MADVPKSELGGVSAAAPIGYACGGKSGTGAITEFSRKGIRVEKGTTPVEKGARVAVEFKIFSTANPIKITATAGEPDSSESFVLLFPDLDTAYRSLLGVVTKKLRDRSGAPCRNALLEDC